MFTQPLMYKAIKSHPTVNEIYSKRLADEGVVSLEDSQRMQAAFRSHLEEEFSSVDGFRPNKADWLDGRWAGMGFAEDDARRGETGVDTERLKIIGRRITSIPPDFNAHKVVRRLLDGDARWSIAARASTGRWPSIWPSARCWARGSRCGCRGRIRSAGRSRSVTRC